MKDVALWQDVDRKPGYRGAVFVSNPRFQYLIEIAIADIEQVESSEFHWAKRFLIESVIEILLLKFKPLSTSFVFISLVP